jgi:L-iditol 2-dehydrogenase
VKALELVGASRLELVDKPVPGPGPGEVRVAVRACGICGSDLHGMDGSSGRRIPPVVMGHEASGVIDALGDGVPDWGVGERVTFDSTVWCGECEFCRSGRLNLCGSRQVIGVSCKDYRRDGAFAEFVVVPARILHRLDEILSFEDAAFAEPVGVALHAVARAGEVSGKSAMVVGTGLIGLLVVQALKRAGARQVIAVDRLQERFDLACALGADEGCLPGMAGGGLETDLVFEAVGTEESVKLAMRAAKTGGRVILIGNLRPEVPLALQRVVTRELDVLGSCAVAGEYPDALEAIAEGEIQVRALITGMTPLERGLQAFEMARHPGALKVLIKPGEMDG